LQEEGYSRDQIYNADKIGLNWKALPDKTLTSKTANSAAVQKMRKEKVIVLVNANTSGSYVLPLFISVRHKSHVALTTFLSFRCSTEGKRMLG